MDNVRLFHQNLQEQTVSCSSSSSVGDMDPSSSFLFAALRYHKDDPFWICCPNDLIIRSNCLQFFCRKKLGELDSIQRYFNRKLSATVVQSASEDNCRAKYEQQGEQDTCQLLPQSSQLVGEVNNIISGDY